MIIAGPHKASIITKVLPSRTIPPELDVAFSAPGAMGEAKLELMRHPPQAPFVAILAGKIGTYRTVVTTHTSQIVLNGPNPETLDRPTLGRLLVLNERIGTQSLLGLIDLRSRLAAAPAGGRGGKQRELDQAQLVRIRATNTITPAEFRTLPGPGSAEARFLRNLAVSG